MIYLVIALGGAAGSLLRYVLGAAVQRNSSGGFPYGTLTVNIIGCLIAGALVGFFLKREPPGELRGFLVVGFCGGFTTFSTFGIETVGLAFGGEWVKAFFYVLTSVTLSLAAATAGLILTHPVPR